ncbi:4-alpha-glucanotransferase [Gammaproteobacteria bacterium]|nr:4-alpha-glucanotransferase [Gammaproteobacteria bacterium]
MKITFKLTCPTEWGQELELVLGDRAYGMEYIDHALWQCILDVQPEALPLNYHYERIDSLQHVLMDLMGERTLPTLPSLDQFTLNDTFGFEDDSILFRTTPFTESIFNQAIQESATQWSTSTHRICVDAPVVTPDQGVAIIGEHELLGEWETFIPMIHNAQTTWCVDLLDAEKVTNTPFKFVIYSKETNAIVRWELGNNRHVLYTQGCTHTQYRFRESYQDWHGTGVAIPVFSLRSKKSWGVGEFYDLKQMVDWAVKEQHQLIQILPINDTTNTGTALDSYPYRANSVYALHPQFVNVEKIGKLKDAQLFKKYQTQAETLNNLEKIDYEAVNQLKRAYLKAIFNEKGQNTLKSQAYKSFYQENEFWLTPYAVFRYLLQQNGTADYRKWGEYSNYCQFDLDAFVEEHQKDLELYYFVQYHLAKQLKEVRDYAHANGVVLKGDLPIGISAESVDAWMSPQLFNLDMQAGAPPDDFSVTGQNWGFPTYNWHEMAKDGYAWWKQRFTNMSRYFDAFRIDHILGFFRIWEIPSSSVWGLLGYFNPALPMTTGEIEQYGLWFDKDRFTKPYITGDHLNTLFADQTQRIINTYFDQKSAFLFQYKPQYDTQAKLKYAVETQSPLQVDIPLLEKLYQLHTEVLFIEDNNRPGYYHPRISLQNSFSYYMLSSDLQYKLARIHDDFYYHRHDAFWKDEALTKLPELLSVTNMLVCGEDLGMVPSCVPEVMDDLHILSLEVERMPKDPTQSFVLPTQTPYRSVSTTGSHDTSSLRAWWLENRELSQHYYNEALGYEGEAPEELSTQLAQEIVEKQLNGNSMWSILPWQDFMAAQGTPECQNPEDERINIPSNPLHIWNWRQK